jgi:hypothetical protein
MTVRWRRDCGLHFTGAARCAERGGAGTITLHVGAAPSAGA